MFAPHTAHAEGTIDHELARERAACWNELGEIAAAEARGKHRAMTLTREANARGDWKAAGFASHEAWCASATRVEHHTAKRLTQTAEALAALPALDEGVRTGELTLDQAAAAVEFATPATDAELARVAVGKSPGEISRVSRTLSPPTAADDQALYARRAFSMKWVGGGRELLVHGRFPLEQGLIVERSLRTAAKKLRAADKKHGETLEWQQYTADALVSLARNATTDATDATEAGGDDRGSVRRNAHTTIVHLSEDGSPALLEGAGVISDATAERLTCGSSITFIKPHGSDLIHTSGGRCITDTQMRYLYKRSRHCQYPGCTKPDDLEAHHMTPWALGGKTEVNQLTLECGRHHQYIHDHDIRVTGTGKNPIYTSADGRRITATQPHVPPG